MRYPPTKDPLVIALRRLLEREGGHVAVGKKARVNDQSLYQIASCRPDSKTGRPKSVGPSIRERLDKAYPDWLEAGMGPAQRDGGETTRITAEPPPKGYQKPDAPAWPFSVSIERVLALPARVLGKIDGYIELQVEKHEREAREQKAA